MKNYLLLLAVAVAFSFLSYGIYSLFGFTDYATLRKIGFLLVILGQTFLPMLILFIIHERSLKAENQYLESLKNRAEAEKQGKQFE
jgi:hypothetical protein